MQQTITFDMDLICRYNTAGPRYTSYPTAVQFHENFGEIDYHQEAKKTNTFASPLSLYLHIPFCDTVCFYCACNKIATKDRDLSSPYLAHVQKEIALQAELFDAGRPVEQLHWGGGTPTFLSHQQMQTLMQTIGEHFQLVKEGEYSIEIDPREASIETIELLHELNFNRMSLGVQDFDPKVQKAVNRIQTEEQTFKILDAARKVGFKSVSIDLIYGLPFQSVESFSSTLEKIVQVMPDRISVFNYAHLPKIFKPQRRINEVDLPSPTAKLEILQYVINYLTEAGYVYIGMDHFALPEDELAVAQRYGTLYRNFQGYSTHAGCDLIGLGTTSIGKVGDTYSQNVKTLGDYYPSIDAGKIPVFRGIILNQDDKLRREVITQLICNFQLDIPAIEKEYQIEFTHYFSEECIELEALQQDGLLTYNDNNITVLPAGRLLIRNICMIFDAYFRQSQNQNFSKVI